MIDHVKMTFGILFVNIIMTILFPSIIIGSDLTEYFYSAGGEGDFRVSNSMLESFGATVNEEGGIQDTNINIIVIFNLIYEFVKLIFTIALATPILILHLSGVWQLLIGIPIIIGYLFAIVGWLYR